MRLFYQIKTYDYETIQEAENHIKQMIDDGWEIHTKSNNERIIYLGLGFALPYEVQYIKFA